MSSSSGINDTKAPDGKRGVQINKSTGVPYVDLREVIESELARIRQDRSRNTVTDAQSEKKDQREAR